MIGTLDEREFKETAERLRQINQVVSELDPAIRSHAFAVLSGYATASRTRGGDGDIEAIAFLVLVEAAMSAQEDLKQVLEELKAINAAKQDIRELRCRIKKDLDSLSEMGEMESLRLQMAMDRLSKLMSTLSNLLKKASETASGITQNIK